MQSTESRFLYDALSFTSKIHSTQDFIELLGLTGVVFQNVNGGHGYKDRLYYEGISIHYNGREDMGIWCEMSGQGCRAFESFGNGNYDAIFELVLTEENDMNLTRLDVAFDDKDGLLDLDRICEDTHNHEYVSTFRNHEVIYGYPHGNSLYFGSKKSDFFIRFYDKAKERGFEDGRHWVRIELQLRRSYAVSFVKKQGSMQTKFLGALKNSVRFVSDNGTDSNKWRWDMKSYWAKFLAGVEAIKLFDRPGVDYNVANLERFVINQSGASIRAYVAIFGKEALFDAITRHGCSFNAKQIELIRKWGKL